MTTQYIGSPRRNEVIITLQTLRQSVAECLKSSTMFMSFLTEWAFDDTVG